MRLIFEEGYRGATITLRAGIDRAYIGVLQGDYEIDGRLRATGVEWNDEFPFDESVFLRWLHIGVLNIDKSPERTYVLELLAHID